MTFKTLDGLLLVTNNPGSTASSVVGSTIEPIDILLGDPNVGGHGPVQPTIHRTLYTIITNWQSSGQVYQAGSGNYVPYPIGTTGLYYFGGNGGTMKNYGGYSPSAHAGGNGVAPYWTVPIKGIYRVVWRWSPDVTFNNAFISRNIGDGTESNTNTFGNVDLLAGSPGYAATNTRLDVGRFEGSVLEATFFATTTDKIYFAQNEMYAPQNTQQPDTNGRRSWNLTWTLLNETPTNSPRAQSLSMSYGSWQGSGAVWDGRLTYETSYPIGGGQDIDAELEDVYYFGDNSGGIVVKYLQLEPTLVTPYIYAQPRTNRGIGWKLPVTGIYSISWRWAAHPDSHVAYITKAGPQQYDQGGNNREKEAIIKSVPWLLCESPGYQSANVNLDVYAPIGEELRTTFYASNQDMVFLAMTLGQPMGQPMNDSAWMLSINLLSVVNDAADPGLCSTWTQWQSAGYAYCYDLAQYAAYPLTRTGMWYFGPSGAKTDELSLTPIAKYDNGYTPYWAVPVAGLYTVTWRSPARQDIYISKNMGNGQESNNLTRGDERLLGVRMGWVGPTVIGGGGPGGQEVTATFYALESDKIYFSMDLKDTPLLQPKVSDNTQWTLRWTKISTGSV